MDLENRVRSERALLRRVPGHSHSVEDHLAGLPRIERAEVLANGKALFQSWNLRDLLSQLELAEQDKRDEELIVHLAVQEEAECFERVRVADKVRLVDHENHPLSAVVIVEQQ